MNDDEPMRGHPGLRHRGPAAAGSSPCTVKPDGEGFVHALDLRRAKAYCIDLPRPYESASTVSRSDPTAGRSSRNPASGTVAQIDLGTLEVSRIARFPHGSIPNWTNVAFCPAGRPRLLRRPHRPPRLRPARGPRSAVPIESARSAGSRSRPTGDGCSCSPERQQASGSTRRRGGGSRPPPGRPLPRSRPRSRGRPRRCRGSR